MSDFAKGFKNHTLAELNEAAEQARDGNEKAKTLLGEMMQPIVIGYLRKIGGSYSPEQRDEMTQAAWVGVWDALGRWENDGRKFSGFAYFYMKGEVQEWLAKNTGVLPLPRQAWAHARTIENIVLKDSNGEQMPYDLLDDELAEIRFGATDRSVKSAGDLFRARRDAYTVSPDFEPRGAQAAEEDHFDEEHGTDGDALDALDAVKAFMADPADEEAAWTTAIEFIDKHDLPIEVAENMMEAAK